MTKSKEVPIQNGEETAKRGPKGRFAVGNQASPGRPPGRGPAAEIRAAIGKDLLAIVNKLAQQALAGDVQAARILLDKAVPSLKPTEDVAPLEMTDGGLADQGRAVLSAVSKGALAPGQGAVLMSALGSLAKLIETDELMGRITALEKQHAKP
jgi:hypothetical protein